MFYTHTDLDQPLGKILLLSFDGRSLTGLYFADQKNAPVIKPDWINDPNLDIFQTTLTQLQQYVRGETCTFTMSCLIMTGTKFQQKVWLQLDKIPYGKTWSYSQLAASVNALRRVRSVAAAVARNPLLILIPCHRIIGKNGRLTGYAGGLERKQALLNIEKTQVQNIDLLYFRPD